MERNVLSSSGAESGSVARMHMSRARATTAAATSGSHPPNGSPGAFSSNSATAAASEERPSGAEEAAGGAAAAAGATAARTKLSDIPGGHVLPARDVPSGGALGGHVDWSGIGDASGAGRFCLSFAARRHDGRPAR